MMRFGMFQYLTYQCMWAQLLSSILHIVSFFYPKVNTIRDVFFTALSFPVSMVVVSNFWAVWFLYGREGVYPSVMDDYLPFWINHVAHTTLAPLNLVTTILVYHKPVSAMLCDNRIRIRLGHLLAILHPSFYGIFVLYIHHRTGEFVYPFLNRLSHPVVGIFLLTVLLSNVVWYETCRIMTEGSWAAMNLVQAIVDIANERALEVKPTNVGSSKNQSKLLEKKTSSPKGPTLRQRPVRNQTANKQSQNKSPKPQNQNQPPPPKPFFFSFKRQNNNNNNNKDRQDNR